jgi:hypothetical protein
LTIGVVAVVFVLVVAVTASVLRSFVNSRVAVVW